MAMIIEEFEIKFKNHPSTVLKQELRYDSDKFLAGDKKLIVDDYSNACGDLFTDSIGEYGIGIVDEGEEDSSIRTLMRFEDVVKRVEEQNAGNIDYPLMLKIIKTKLAKLGMADLVEDVEYVFNMIDKKTPST